MSDSPLLRGPQTWTGAILIDKPEGITSAHVLDRFKRVWRSRYGWKSREIPTIGHGGTLDPFATGLLVVLIGNATRLSQYLLGSDKTYHASITFGVQTQSGDFTGDVVKTTSELPESREILEKAGREFLKDPYLQIPPMVSAKKKEGVALHVLARQGIEIERAPVPCRISELNFTWVSPNLPLNEVEITTRVSGGTYIRTLAEDLAASVGSLAHLKTLRRLASGPFSIQDAVTMNEFEKYLAEAPEDFDTLKTQTFWVSPKRLTWKLPLLEVSDEISKRARRGDPTLPQELGENFLGTNPLPSSPHEFVIANRDDLIAILRADSITRQWKYGRVFPL